MVKKIVAICTVFLILHSLFISQYDGIGYPTHQMQSNIIRTQQYMYNPSSIAIVGTSLSARILMDSLPNSVSLLSFGGCTVEDGLDLILAKKEKPNIVFVETNLLSRSKTSNFINDNIKKVPNEIRKHIPVLREENQPICLIAGILLHMTNINPQAGFARVDTAFLHKTIDYKLAEEQVVDENFELERLKLIKGKINILEKQGIKFIFFRMPVNERLDTFAPDVEKYALLQKVFPRTSYEYMLNDTSKYLTTDGIHLDYNGQKKFSSFFRKKLDYYIAKYEIN